jgi:hypothetical protein
MGRQRASGHDGIFDSIFFLLEFLNRSLNYMQFQACCFESNAIGNISINLHNFLHATSLVEAARKLHRPNVSRKYNSPPPMITRSVGISATYAQVLLVAHLEQTQVAGPDSGSH